MKMPRVQRGPPEGSNKVKKGGSFACKKVLCFQLLYHLNYIAVLFLFIDLYC